MQSKAAGGFAGQMEELKFKLDAYRHSVPEDRNWPKDSTRLSTRLGWQRPGSSAGAQ